MSDKNRLGRYILDRRIATGGMAEIWLAHQEGPAGFAKEIVIKRILRHLSDDEKFVEMFLDEARVAARLAHPNIAQIFDLGEADGEYFIAMEFVDGWDVSAIIDRAARVGQTIPAAVAARIVADGCTGLDYAHSFVDRDGVHANLVHRDVSPQNMLVSRDGVIKLVDFGVAKAASSTHKTQTGAVKGKLSYMSPEQISGNGLDARSDIFALGIVLYELCTLQRPFGHESELLAITAILNEQPTMPRALRHELPIELEDIILRALEKDPGSRYQRAADMGRALEQALANSGTILTGRDVAAWLGDLFSEHPTGEVPGVMPMIEHTAGGIANARTEAFTHVEHPSRSTRPAHDDLSTPSTEPPTSEGPLQPAVVTPPEGGGGVRLGGALASAAARSAANEDGHELDETMVLQGQSKAPLIAVILLMLFVLSGGGYFLYTLISSEASVDSSSDVALSDRDTAAQTDAGASTVAVADVGPETARLAAEGSEAPAEGSSATAGEAALAEGSAAAADADAADAADRDAGEEATVALIADAEVASADAANPPAPDVDPPQNDTREPPPAPDVVPPDAPSADVAVEEESERVVRRPANGTIMFVSSGGGRHEFFVDGRSACTAPPSTCRHEATPGPHRVRAEASDGRVFEGSVTIEAGETTRVTVRY